LRGLRELLQLKGRETARIFFVGACNTPNFEARSTASPVNMAVLENTKAHEKIVEDIEGAVYV